MIEYAAFRSENEGGEGGREIVHFFREKFAQRKVKERGREGIYCLIER